MRQQRSFGSWPLLAVILVPALEIWGILRMGGWIGAGPTFLLILAAGVAGIYIMRKEGTRAWREAQRQLQAGQPPGHALLNGLCVLIGGVLLLVPGFFSDIVGLTLIAPPTRRLYRGWIIGWLERRMKNGSLTIRRW